MCCRAICRLSSPKSKRYWPETSPHTRPCSRLSREAVHFRDGPASHKRRSARSESTMPVVVVVGGQWGDEGKGRIVDL
ncbi:MAG: adenylosuccinate synthetase, partial [Dehalococcoidia bacterium]|nr:adenylosuccinate synthetase [Dehalococcoidia bacterium]